MYEKHIELIHLVKTCLKNLEQGLENWQIIFFYFACNHEMFANSNLKYRQLYV